MADPKVKFKRSSVSGKRPTVDNVELGEIALNTYDGRLYTLQDTGGIGIGTTTTLLTPWQESYGGSGISYTGDLNVTGVTTITGSFNVTSFSTFNGNIKLFDGKYLNLGNSNDLQIVHDGNNAVIQNSTGQIFFDNNSEGGDIFLRANDNVVIRVDGNDTVFTAQTGGIDVTGHVETDTLQVSGITTTASLEVTGNTETGTLNVSGIVTASSLDISGNVDVDGTLEADAITIDGVSLAETISDTVGAMVSSNTETNISVTYDDSDNTLDFVIGTLNQDTTGNAATATALETARTIGGVSFDGTGNINLPGVNATGNQDTSGNAATATALETARTIGGVSFDGTGNINLPGVNQAGNQNTSGTAAGLSGAPSITVTDITAVGNVSIAGTLTYEDVTSIDAIGIVTARTGVRVTTGGLIVSAGGANITGGITGDLTGDVTGNVTGNTSGSSGSCTGNSATATEATNFTVTANNSTNETVYPVFVDGATGTQGAETDTGLTYNPSTGNLTSTKFTGSGSSLTGLTGASSATYGSSEVTPVIAVDSNGRITGISTVATSGLGLVTKDVTKVTATGGQTVFSGTYSVGFVDVFLNGSKLDSTEFTATNGTSITLTTGATANDIIEIVGFTVSGSSGTSITQGDTSAQVVDSGSDGHFKVSTDGSERLRIDSSGRVGLGTDSPSSLLHLSGSGNQYATVTSTNSANAGILFGDSSDNDAGYILYVNSVDSLLFGTGGATERMRINGSGYVAIGGNIITDSNLLNIQGSGATKNIGIVLNDTNASKIYGISNGSSSLKFYDYTASAERMRIDSSGRLLVGQASSPSIGSGQYAKIFVAGYAGGSPGGAIISIARDEAASAMSSGDTLGELIFSDNAGGTFASVKGSVDGGPSGTSDFPGRLVFSTTADGASSPTERMRIDSSGNVGIGIASPAEKLEIGGTASAKINLRSNNDSTGVSGLHFGDASSATAGRLIYNHSDDSLAFYVNANERARIDSSGRLLLGTTTEGYSSADTLTIAESGNCGLTIRSGTSSLGTIAFSDATSGAGEYAGYIQYSQTNTYMGFGVGSAERLRITSTGLLLGGSDSEFNTTLGGNAGDSMTGTAYYNTLIGQDAGTAMTTADTNTAVGAYALSTATTASMTCAFGHKALFSSNAWYNNAFGKDALENCSTGAHNNAFGYLAMESHTTGANNSAFGDQALSSNTTSWSNSAFGAQALKSNTGASNTAVGRGALYTNTSGYQNASVGRDSMYDNDTGINDAALGYRSLRKNTSGSDNVAIGRDSGYFNTTGSGNIVIGSCNSSGSYAPVFGLSTSNNRVVMGSTAVTNAYVQVAWTVVSDARDKMNFGTVPHGLEFIKQLNPVSFQFKFERDSDTPNGPVRYGFKAQDILALEGEDSAVIIDNDDPDKLRYNGEALVPVLVNAIKEQQTIIDTLIARLDAAGI